MMVVMRYARLPIDYPTGSPQGLLNGVCVLLLRGLPIIFPLKLRAMTLI